MSSLISFREKVHSYLLVSPEGEEIEIPRELYGALQDFLQKNRQTGSILIQFRNGGVAGLEAVVKRTYK